MRRSNAACILRSVMFRRLIVIRTVKATYLGRYCRIEEYILKAIRVVWEKGGGGPRIDPIHIILHSLAGSSFLLLRHRTCQYGAPLHVQSPPRTLVFLPILRLSSCVSFVFQPACKISWAKAGCFDSLVRVLLRCHQARSLHVEAYRIA